MGECKPIEGSCASFLKKYDGGSQLAPGSPVDHCSSSFLVIVDRRIGNRYRDRNEMEEAAFILKTALEAGLTG